MVCCINIRIFVLDFEHSYLNVFEYKSCNTVNTFDSHKSEVHGETLMHLLLTKASLYRDIELRLCNQTQLVFNWVWLVRFCFCPIVIISNLNPYSFGALDFGTSPVALRNYESSDLMDGIRLSSEFTGDLATTWVCLLELLHKSWDLILFKCLLWIFVIRFATLHK